MSGVKNGELEFEQEDPGEERTTLAPQERATTDAPQ